MLKRILGIPLYIQILVSIFLAILLGQLIPQDAELFSIPVLGIYEFLGDLFLQALKMLIVPLIVSAVITSMAGLGKDHAFGRLGLKTLSYYATTSILAILTGLFLVNITEPGLKDGQPNSILKEIAAPEEEVSSKVGDRGMRDIVEIFLRMLPPNIIKAAVEGQMLGLIVFSILFGYFIVHIRKDLSKSLTNTSEAVYEVMLKITSLVMRFAPIGVFGLVAEVSVKSDLDLFLSLFKFFLTVLFALGIHLFVTMPILLSVIGRVNPFKHYRAMFPALLTSFSTASSSATLPVTMECLQHKAGVSRRISNFTTPLGATVNMDGTALYECVAVIFLIQVYGGDLSFATQMTTVVLALLTSIGVAGVPSASLVAILVILNAVGMPKEALGLLMVFDRILDMCRTSVNVFSDSCGAVIIARTEGEKTKLLS